VGEVYEAWFRSGDHSAFYDEFSSTGQGTEESSGGEAKRVPFRLFLGDKYYAEGDLDVRCAVNNQNAICELHIK